MCLLAVGKLAEAAEQAAVLLAEQGVDATVWGVRVAKPLDPEMLEDAARHRLVVTAEDGFRVGGVGSSVADALAGRARVVTLGIPDNYVPQGKPNQILADLGLDPSGSAASVRDTLGA